MTLADELEMRCKTGTDLIFIHGLLAMTRKPESERELYRALHEVNKRMTNLQTNNIIRKKT